MIKEIGKITIYVNNVEEAKKFWLEKMNFIIKFEAEMGPGFKWLQFFLLVVLLHTHP